MRKFLALALLAFLSFAATCQIKPTTGGGVVIAPIPPPTPAPAPAPAPIPNFAIGIVVQRADLSRIDDATVQLHYVDGYHTQQTDNNGYTQFVVPADLPDSDVIIDAAGFDTFRAHVTIVDKQNYFYALAPVAPPFPPPLTKAQVLRVNTTFQGLDCATSQFGVLPWFDAALFSLNASDRQGIYACKKSVGDDHAVVQFDSNSGSIYNEPGQPYQQMNGAAFATNLPGFVNAVEEVIQHGFTPIVFLGGDDGSTCGQTPVPPQCGYVIASSEFPSAYQALKNASVGDLNQYVIYMPGWDGVFYGWTPAMLGQFGTQVKSTCPECYLGIESQTGHIPAGNGPADWAPGGLMSQYDIVFVEFNDSNIHDDTTWQILGRLLGPAYKRPADQPTGDDPHPPFYLMNGQVVDCFEYGEYEWVRQLFTLDEIATMRAYLYSAGCPVVN